MKKTALLITLLVACATLSGCFKTSFVYNNVRPSGDVTEETRGHLLFGLVAPDKAYRADRVCPGGVQSVEYFESFGNICLSCITLSIYTPRTIKVTCAAGNAHNFYLNEQDQVVAHESIDPVTGQSTVEDFSSSVF